MSDVNVVTLKIVLDIHRQLLERFGGSPGVRDAGGLESAIAQVGLDVFGGMLHDSPESRASAVLYHITRNHPFVDGNKRTAYGAMETQLLLEGFVLKMPDDEAYELVNAVARGELDKAQIAERLKAHLQPFE